MLLICINFQFGFELNNPITENFVYKLALLLKQYKGFHVSIGEDFILNYDKICEKAIGNDHLIAGETCTPIRKIIADSPIILQSSSMHPQDNRDHKARYRNFNIYYKEIGTLSFIQTDCAEMDSRPGKTNTQNIHSSSGNLPTKTKYKLPFASCSRPAAPANTTEVSKGLPLPAISTLRCSPSS